MINKLSVCLFVMLAFSCKKKEEYQFLNQETIDKYDKKGYRYLFSINPTDSETIRPIFIGQDPENNIKFIISKRSGSNIYTESGAFQNNNFSSWVLNGIDFSHMGKFIDFDLYGKLVVENDKGLLYSEKDSKFTQNIDQTEFVNSLGDSMKLFRYADPVYIYNSLIVAKKMNFTSPFFNVSNPYTYNSRIYERNGKTLLVYFAYDTTKTSAWDCNLDLLYVERSGLGFQNQVKSNKLLENHGGTTGYVSGQDIHLIENDKKEPGIVFNHGNRINFYNPYMTFRFLESLEAKEIKVISINIDGNANRNVNADINYFYYKNEFYVYTNDLNYLNEGFNLLKVKGNSAELLDLNINNVVGIFGSNKGVIVAVKNDAKGIDILSLNL